MPCELIALTNQITGANRHIVDLDQPPPSVIVIRIIYCSISALPVSNRQGAERLGAFNDEATAYRGFCGITCSEHHADRQRRVGDANGQRARGEERCSIRCRDRAMARQRVARRQLGCWCRITGWCGHRRNASCALLRPRPILWPCSILRPSRVLWPSRIL